MTKVKIKPTNRLEIDKASAYNYITDMVFQLYEISDLAGLDREARLLHAVSLALSTEHRIYKG